MNAHLPQNVPSQVEVKQIMAAKHQYISGTKGEPLRGLIQDHVISAVHMTWLDTFLEKELFKSLVYQGLARAVDLGYVTRIKMVQPALI